MSQTWLKYIVVAGALLCSAPGNAQNTSVGITPCGAGIALSASNVSSNNILSDCGTTAVVWNTGTVDVFVNWGTASNTAATTSGWPIPAGSSMSLNTGHAPLYLAVITGSGSATVRVVQGNGSPVISSGGTSTISGSITANQGTSPWIVAGGGVAGTAATGVVSVQGIASMTPVQVSQATASNLNATVIGTGAAGTAAMGVLSVQGIAAMTPVQVSQATAANLNATVIGTGTFATQSAVTAASGSYASGAFSSGSFASGSHASGSFASGAFASGSVASGAYASGSLASGSMVDVVALSAPVAPATATATKSALAGCQATSAGITPTTGQQAAIDCDLNNNVLVSAGGAPNLAITQVSVTTADTAVVSARVLRRAVTIQQITGTQNVFCNQTTATAGNGIVLPAVVGASITLNTTSAIRCIAITGSQTVAVAETY